MRILIAALLAAAASLSEPAAAQEATGHIVSTYRAAPGHQMQLLEWMARQDEIGRAAGLPATQLYVHQNGDSWDFLTITPQTTDAQDEAVAAAARRMGAPSGPRIGLELREHISSHTDTLAAGPTTAADWLRRLRE